MTERKRVIPNTKKRSTDGDAVKPAPRELKPGETSPGVPKRYGVDKTGVKPKRPEAPK